VTVTEQRRARWITVFVTSYSIVPTAYRVTGRITV
jgi:hypothetical protein